LFRSVFSFVRVQNPESLSMRGPTSAAHYWNNREKTPSSFPVNGSRAAIACSIHATKDDPDNPGTGRDSQLAHDHPDKCPHRVGANIHSPGNFLVCEPLNQELDDFPFAVRQAKRLTHLSSTP